MQGLSCRPHSVQTNQRVQPRIKAKLHPSTNFYSASLLFKRAESLKEGVDTLQKSLVSLSEICFFALFWSVVNFVKCLVSKSYSICNNLLNRCLVALWVKLQINPAIGNNFIYKKDNVFFNNS